MNINLTILGQAIMFVIFVWICMKYIWPPLNSMIEKRQKEIADGLNAAEQARKELDIARIQVEEMLLQAKVNAKAIIEEAGKRKFTLIEQAKTEALHEKSVILDRAKSEIELLKRQVKDELKQQVALLTIAGAQKIIERSLDENTNADIIDKIINDL